MNNLNPKPYTLNPQHGFVALMSAIIISVLLLAVTVSLGFSAFFTRFNILDSEDKERSSALAEACGDTAILDLAGNTDYVLTAPDHTVPVGADKCNIVSLSTPRTFPITIQTQACINKSFTNLNIKINSDFSINSWQEVPNLSPNNPCT